MEDLRQSIVNLDSISVTPAPPDFLIVTDDDYDDDDDSVITVSTYSASSEGDEDPDDIYEDGYEDIFAFDDDDDYGPFW